MNKITVLLMGLGLLAFGCGKAADPIAVAPAAQVAAPVVTTVNTNDNTGLLNACNLPNDWGYPIVSGTGKICQATQRITSSTGLISVGNASRGFVTILPLRTGDKVSFSSASGSWGKFDDPCSSHLGGLITTCTYNYSCNKTATGASAGLMAAIGLDIFPISDITPTHVATADGMVRIGFNVPLASQVFNWCGSWDVTATIQHCQDAVGNTVACL